MSLKKHRNFTFRPLLLCALSIFLVGATAVGQRGVIEEKLAEIGSVPNEEIIVVQRKYTRKNWRHELTPFSIGGIPFGSIRRTIMGGARYTLHFNDKLAWEAFNFIYTKNFFSNFTDDINANPRPGQPPIRPDVQQLLLIATTGLQWTPFYGKIATLSEHIAYIEPFFSGGFGWSKTDLNNYLTFFFGAGMRVFFREWVSLNFELRDLMYSEDSVTRTVPAVETSNFRHNFAISLALSFWLPKMPR